MEGVLRGTLTESFRTDHTLNKRVMDHILLGAVRAVVTDVAANIADNNVAAAATRTALAGVAADTAVAAADNY